MKIEISTLSLKSDPFMHHFKYSAANGVLSDYYRTNISKGLDTDVTQIVVGFYHIGS